MQPVPGFLYLVHMADKVSHARHYLGWTGDVTSRIQEHRKGRGSRLLAHAASVGIPFRVVRVWTGTRVDERALKGRRGRGLTDFCPVCRKRPRVRLSLTEAAVPQCG